VLAKFTINQDCLFFSIFCLQADKEFARQRKNETREKRAQRKKKRKGPSKKNEEKMS
jgi:hypothetical protein